ncbi:conserved Plasmodium protein, unknown function [Plasmodium sp. DRC-Itaito]|nr:conserved Plasmodium protein, unknown function [Plasmodium sp. DRC-Itaito]
MVKRNNMNDEEKVLYKFIENKILLKEFCDDYVAIKKNEEALKEECNKVKLENVQLENEKEKYVEIIKNIDIKKEKEIDSSIFEYDTKIKKLEKQIEFLNDSLNTEKENYNHKVKEYMCLQLEYEKCKEYLKTDKNKNVIDTINNNQHHINDNNINQNNINENNINQNNINENNINQNNINQNNINQNNINQNNINQNNINQNNINQNNINQNNINQNNINQNNINQNSINVLNKIYININEKIRDLLQQIKEIKTCRYYMEQNIKGYQSLLNDYLKKITDLNLKYDECYKLYKQTQYKNLIYKWQKKLFICEIELLKNNNQILTNQIILFKKNIKKVDAEKKEYYTLLKKAEKENFIFLHKLKKRNYTKMLQDLENTNTNTSTNTYTNTSTTFSLSSKDQLVQKNKENNLHNKIDNDTKYEPDITYKKDIIHDKHIINDNNIIHNNNIKHDEHTKLQQAKSSHSKESPKDKTTIITHTPSKENISDNKQNIKNKQMINVNNINSKMLFVSNKVLVQKKTKIRKGMLFFSDNDTDKSKRKNIYIHYSL